MYGTFNNVFDEADQDGDGYLNMEEFKSFYTLSLEKMKKDYGDAPPHSDEMCKVEWNAYSQIAANQ